MTNPNDHILELVCMASNAALLCYANRDRGVGSVPSLQRFAGDPIALADQRATYEAELARALAAQPDSRYGRLLALLGEDEAGRLARRALDLCILEHCAPAVDLLLAPLQDTPECAGVSVELALQIYFDGPRSAAGEGVSHFVCCMEAYSRLAPFVLADTDPSARYRRRLSADARLMGWLCQDDTPDDRLCALAQLYLCAPGAPPSPLFDGESLARQAQGGMFPADGRMGVVHLCGEPGSGRRLLARHAAYGLGRCLLSVDCRALPPPAEDPDGAAAAAHLIAREVLLYNAAVCWHDFDPERCSSYIFARSYMGPAAAHGAAQFVTSAPDAEFLPPEGAALTRILLPPPDRSARIRLWEGFAARCHLELDCLRCAVKYRLGPAEIESAVRQLALLCAGGGAVTDALVSRVCMDALPPPAHGSLRQVKSGYRFEDLKLPPEQKKVLQAICDHIWYSHTVYDDWQLERRFPYGRGVTALFTGAPGTGKTMAAHVLSEMLDIPLYRVEISAVVDKYIGETEKHLEKIFAMAEKSNTILFFDEADSLFGKRSEVSDAKDKYANTEVSYILQRIEQYDGIVILSSNYRRNIDEAFMRRMRYVVDFPMPNAAIRREIWKSCFTPATPLEHIDYAFLADKFELSGGSIKNIALNAAFAAASEGSPITMHHLLVGIRAENLKAGKPMLNSDFENYSHLL